MKRLLNQRPLFINDREPGRIPGSVFIHHRLAKNSLETEAKSLRCVSRGGVQTVTFPLITAVAQRIENVPHEQELCFGRGWRLLPALKSLDQDDRVLCASTFSQVLFPGLRLGYLVVPESHIESFRDSARQTRVG